MKTASVRREEGRRVVFVAYFFPPLGGGGVQRTLAFVRHLPAAGWMPVVVAPRDPGYEIRDPALLESIAPELEVHRSRSPEPWWPLFRSLQRLRRRLSGAAARGAETDRGGSSIGRPSPEDRLSVRLAANVFFPDEHLAWLPFAVLSAVRVARRRRVDVLFSTSPPITGHLIAGLTSRLTGIPWVADFRDPWVGNPFLPTLSRPLRAAQRWLERWIVSRADVVIAPTPTLVAALRARYADLPVTFHLITNGYDLRELAPIRQRRVSSDELRLVYAGSAYGGVVAPFVAGLELFAASHPDLASRLRVEFIGWLDTDSRRCIERLDSDPRTAGWVTAVGHRPRSEALAAVAGADAALYLLDDDPRKAMFVGGKLYEYIGLGIPVLAVIPPGDARWVLESLGWGIVADPVPTSVCEALVRLFEGDANSGDADPEGRFDRGRLTAELAALLDVVASAHGASSGDQSSS